VVGMAENFRGDEGKNMVRISRVMKGKIWCD
jgi:hypothetical protein